ncbi:MAG: hypothetical protein IKD31_05595 [Clostridia bacterium]|nr:hypothetical protein [Clostridia bacterium]
MNVSILDYGAVPGGEHLNTAAIQAAVDAVAEAGGGRVSVPAGVFLSGSIFLQDHVELHLEAGSILKASACLDDYNAPDAYPENWGSDKEEWTGKHLIIAHHKTGVSVTGLGTIDGAGEAFFEEPHRCKSFNYTWGYGIAKAKNKETLRAGQLMVFVECTDVFLSDFSVFESPCWTVFLYGCERVRVRGLHIRNTNTHANTDGIDIDTCRFVTVSDCIITTGDDAITVRASCSHLLSGKRVCEHVSISNCVISTSAVAVRVGVGVGEVHNVNISGLTVARAGTVVEFITSYKKRGGVSMSDILVENIVADQVSFPLRFFQENGAYIRNIRIRNIRAKAMCSSHLVADDAGMISDISIRDMKVDFIDTLYVLDERAPDEKGWYAIWGKGAEDVELDHLEFVIPEALSSQWKGLCQMENCKNLKITDCNFEA